MCPEGYKCQIMGELFNFIPGGLVYPRGTICCPRGEIKISSSAGWGCTAIVQYSWTREHD